MNEIKILLLCSSRFALPAMQQLLFFKQLSVVAIPGHCEDMIGETKEFLKTTGIPLIILKKENFTDQLITAIAKHNITTGLIMTFSYIIPPAVYELVPSGFYNVHPGPLPGYRGADPIFQQIKNKEKFAEVTIHKVEAVADSGAVILKEAIPLLPDDTYGLLSEKLAHTAARLVNTLIKLIGFGFAVPSKKQDESKANYFKRQSAKDISIDWERMDADTIVALINACNPWNKGAVTRVNNKIMRLVNAEKIENDIAEKINVGVITSVNDEGMFISTCEGNSIKVTIVFLDEGFFTAERLKQFGLVPGVEFGKI